MTRQERAVELAKELHRIYPEAHCELNFSNPLSFLSQPFFRPNAPMCGVQYSHPALFDRCRTALDYARLLRRSLRPSSTQPDFYRNKARSIRRSGLGGCKKNALEKAWGVVLVRMAELAALPVSGERRANVVLGNAFHLNEGVVVDTHVARLSRRLVLTPRVMPVKIEQDLISLFPLNHGQISATG